MPTCLPSDFKRGLPIFIDGAPHRVEEFHTTGTAKTRHKVNATMRNLQTGRLTERTFTENESVELARMEQRNVQFSYRQGDREIFLDSVTYDELTLSSEQLGERRLFLKENEEYRATFVEGKFLDIDLPDNVTLKVEETGPPQRSSQQSTSKPAVLSGGLTVMVPPFIAIGEVIKVDTRTGKYMGKEHAG